MIDHDPGGALAVALMVGHEVDPLDRIALIADIHGNMPALQATLDDIERRGISRIVCLGDLVGKGPHSERAVDVCRERCEWVIRGNWDEGLAEPNDHPTVRWRQARLGPDRLTYLRTLPNSDIHTAYPRTFPLRTAIYRGLHGASTAPTTEG